MVEGLAIQSGRGKQLRGLTEREKELLDAMLSEKNLTDTCKQMGISVPMGSRRKRNIVNKYLLAREIIREVDFYRVRMASKLGI